MQNINLYLKLLENILINADDDENINEPGCSYETGSTGQKRKGEKKKNKDKRSKNVMYISIL